MANNRTDQVVGNIIEAVRKVLVEDEVSFAEFREAIGFLIKVADAGEIPLMADAFFNSTIVDVINRKAQPGTSTSDLEGPYFLEAPELEDGRMPTMKEFENAEGMIVRGKVKSTRGAPLAGVLVDIWCSTPDGRYSGFHQGVPTDSYRGKIRTKDDGSFAVEGTVPVPYRIPDTGPTGELLTMMGRHSWRPAHVHLKFRQPGFEELTTQLYFEESDYLHDDCCEGVVPSEFIFSREMEEGKRILETDFVLEPEKVREAT